MFGLVHFPDQTYGIYSMKNISKKKGDNNACIVKHRGAKYEAVLITEKEKKEELRVLQDEMVGQLKSVKKSVSDNNFTDSKIGEKYVDMDRPSTSSINHKYVSSVVKKDEESSDEAIQEQREEQRILQDETLEQRESVEKSIGNNHSTDSKIGKKYVDMERPSTSSINHEYVSTVEGRDEQSSDEAIQEQREEQRILQEETLEQRESVEKSIGDNHSTDSKIGKKYVDMDRPSTSSINHEYVSTVEGRDEQSSDGAFQEKIIIEDILLNPRRSPEKSLVYEDFNDFSIGTEYVEINRSSTSLMKNFDDTVFSTVCGEEEDRYAEFQDNSTMEASDMNVDKNKQSIMQHHGIPVQVEPEDEIELSVYGDNSDDDSDYNLSTYSETQSDNSRDGSRSSTPCSFLSEMDLNIEEKTQPNGSNNNSLSKSIQVHLSASLNEPGCDDENMMVTESRGRKGDKKANFCFYCHTKQQKISRHLENKHSGEEEVKKFIMLPKGNVERAKIIGQIRKRGNFLFNTNENLNDGELIVARRPKSSRNKSGRDYSACANCKGFFSKATLRVHFRSCTGIDSDIKRLPNLLSKKITSRIHPMASITVRNHLFPPLREDDVCRAIRYDELIIIYANKMVEKYREPRHFQMIRQRLRLIGNFLIKMKALSKEINNLASIYDPKFVDMVLSAINMCARYTETTNCFEAPSVAFSLGTLLKQIGNLLITECIKNHKEEMRKNAKYFLKVFAQEVNINVNRTVAETQLKMSRTKTVMLPTMGDIKKLSDYLTKKRKDALEKLKICFSSLAWIDLAEATLTSIQVFNRRRAGEVERISITEFEKYETIERSNNDLFQSLSEKSKEIAKKYVRFTIRGKLNRTVPVLLDTHLCECIQLIIKNRTNMRVHKSNPYVFGTPGSDTKKHPHLSACTLMRKFSEACGAEHPTRLRGTNLRKHIATTCITLNLENQDVVDLSNFMGHSEKIHKGIYRQPIISRDILGISQLLQTAQGENENASSDDSENEVVNDEEPIPTNEINSTGGTPNLSGGNRRNSSKAHTLSGTLKRVRWTQEEKDAIFRIFGEYMNRKALPPLKVIQTVIKETPVLQNRTSPQIKTWIHNQLKGSKKKLSFSN
ncbi:uncharacterized protein LOC123682945 [Harmonia axyridis]|uniref:uncharacterized protein LOC123682945 n=1 Tax=Harmonia axyridis TaxID=115357 RepID=UPI001E2769F8|nr:uncharacterized protein LOC123682945 [Harmonia axyridis]